MVKRQTMQGLGRTADGTKSDLLLTTYRLDPRSTRNCIKSNWVIVGIKRRLRTNSRLSFCGFILRASFKDIVIITVFNTQTSDSL
jgi:hypothetical protein